MKHNYQIEIVLSPEPDVWEDDLPDADFLRKCRFETKSGSGVKLVSGNNKLCLIK